MARARPAARRDRGRGQDARAAAHRVPRVRRRPPTAGSTPTCASPCCVRSDAEGLARDDTVGRGRRRRSRRRLLPDAALGPRRRSRRRGARRRARRRGARRRRARHAARRRGPEVARVAEVADDLRREIVGDVVTFVRNRNINYTNVCTFKCRFCAFSKGPLSLNLRGDPYLLDLDEIQRRVVEAVECGATEVCLQGGIHPDFDGDYYLDVARAVKDGRARHPHPRLHRARGHRGRTPARHAAARLPARWPRTPGSRRCPAPPPRSSTTRSARSSAPTRSTPTSGSRRTAPPTRVGLRSNITIMFGHVERPVHVARHLVRTRALQQETGGFTEFVPLPFVHMATPIYLQKRARTGPDVPRGAAHPRRRPHRVPRARSTTSRCRG